MSLKMSKGKEILALVAIFCCGFAIMHDMALMVIYNELYNVFPDSPFGVNIIVSFTMAITMVGSLIAPLLLKKFSKKQVLVVTTFIFAVSAVFGASVVNIVYMNIMNAINALSQGVTLVCGAGLITDLYINDEIKRGKVMGVYQGCMSLFGAVISALAGVMAMDSWTNVYNIYWFGFVAAVLMLLFIPKGIKSSDELPAETPDSPEAPAASGKKSKFSANFWMTGLIFILSYFMYTFCIMFTSVYIEENNIGNADFAGMMVSICNIASFLCQISLGFIVQKFHRNTLRIMIVIGMIGSLAMYFLTNSVGCIIGTILVGASYATISSYSFIEMPSMAPAGKINLSISLCSVFTTVGIFVGANIATAVMSASSINTAILLGVFIAAVAFVLELFVGRKDRKSAPAAE